MNRYVSVAMCLAAVTTCNPAIGDEAASPVPKAIPATRPQIKVALQALQDREPRLPLPPPTADEIANAGEFGLVNNLRMRKRYLPEAWLASQGGFSPDPSMTIERVLKTQCFWIVSRVNNCHYCLGHQEFGLATRYDLSDNRIASLDSDWSIFLPKEQAAFALARQMTLEPHLVADADIDDLRQHFTDREIVELIYTIANFNATNRWTDSLGIPQDRAFGETQVRFDAAIDERFRDSTSVVLPDSVTSRPPLESREAVAVAFSTCRTRTPRVPAATEAETLAVRPASDEPVRQWERALALFPALGAAQIAHRRAVLNEGRISPLLKAQIAWTSARQNRAWYSLSDARRRLVELGVSADEIFAEETHEDSQPSDVRAALAFARKLTAEPQAIADADVAALREHFSDHETAEIVYVTCNANGFDRFTETLGLPLDD